MELEPYVDKLREQLAVAASAGGEEALSLAQRLHGRAGIRRATDPPGCALGGGRRDHAASWRRARSSCACAASEPEFVVALPPAETAGEQAESPELSSGRTSSAGPSASASGEGATARINLRLPDQLKSQVEQSADREGLSINAWLVRAVAAAVDRGRPGAGAARATDLPLGPALHGLGAVSAPSGPSHNELTETKNQRLKGPRHVSLRNTTTNLGRARAACGGRPRRRRGARGHDRPGTAERLVQGRRRDRCRSRRASSTATAGCWSRDRAGCESGARSATAARSMSRSSFPPVRTSAATRRRAGFAAPVRSGAAN